MLLILPGEFTMAVHQDAWTLSPSNRNGYQIDRIERNTKYNFQGIQPNVTEFLTIAIRFERIFSLSLELFGSFWKVSEVWERARTCSDLSGYIWMRSDVFGCVQIYSDSFKSFAIVSDIVKFICFCLLRFWMFFESFLAFSAALYVGASTADVHRRTSSYVGVRRQCHTSTYVVVRWRRSTHVAVCWRTSTYVERVAHLDANVARSFESSTKFIDRIDRRLLW